MSCPSFPDQGVSSKADRACEADCAFSRFREEWSLLMQVTDERKWLKVLDASRRRETLKTRPSCKTVFAGPAGVFGRILLLGRGAHYEGIPQG